MNNHEKRARELKEQGNNCSTSLHKAFMEDTELSNDIPAPRSIEGKCGALITAQKILKETGHEDKVEEIEKEFIKRFGYAKCVELMAHEKRCNDYVGESANMVDEILNKE